MKLLLKFLAPAIFIFSFIITLVALLYFFTGSVEAGTQVVLYASYILFFATIGGLLLGFVLGVIINPQGVVSSLISLGVLAVIFLIAYFISGNEVTAVYKKFDITPFQSQLFGGILIMTY
ncbi:MAG TPA: hypothetical protein DCM08_14160, partial [Microscillaceae bacterium]|nr:hypothetical protein [Microscillaceae bacterium]